MCQLIDRQNSKKQILCVGLFEAERELLLNACPNDFIYRFTESPEDIFAVDEPDIILCHYVILSRMNDVTRKKVVYHINQKNTPVILISEPFAAQEIPETAGLQQCDFLLKPINIHLLAIRMRNFLQLNQARSRLMHQNQLLFDDVRRQQQDNKNQDDVFQQILVTAFSQLIQLKDPRTSEHLHRTQRYMRLFLDYLHIHPDYLDVVTQQYIELVTRASPLHDIGNIGIPDDILKNKLSLNECDSAFLSQHTVFGYNAIVDAEKITKTTHELFTLAKEMIRFHHENWDGSGFPDGLKGYQIPLSARLLTIVDAYDELTARQHLSHEIAINQLLQDNYHRYDAKLVEIFSIVSSIFPRFEKQ